jgi:hypothetical protein
LMMRMRCDMACPEGADRQPERHVDQEHSYQNRGDDQQDYICSGVLHGLQPAGERHVPARRGDLSSPRRRHPSRIPMRTKQEGPCCARVAWSHLYLPVRPWDCWYWRAAPRNTVRPGERNEDHAKLLIDHQKYWRSQQPPYEAAFHEGFRGLIKTSIRRVPTKIPTKLPRGRRSVCRPYAQSSAALRSNYQASLMAISRENILEVDPGTCRPMADRTVR